MRVDQLFMTICLLTTIILPASVSATDDVTGTQDQTLHHSDPDEVFYVVYVADVTEINAQEQSFDVNMAVRLRWKDERLAHSDLVPRTMLLENVWNPMLLVTNPQSKIWPSLPEVVEVEPDGTVRYLQRYVGSIAQPLRLSRFPRDSIRERARPRPEGRVMNEYSWRDFPPARTASHSAIHTSLNRAGILTLFFPETIRL